MFRRKSKHCWNLAVYLFLKAHSSIFWTSNKPTEFKAPAITQRAREPRKCGDHLIHGYKCKQALVINVLTGELPTDNIVEQEYIDKPSQEQNTGEDQWMKISLQAMQANNVDIISIAIIVWHQVGEAHIEVEVGSDMLDERRMSVASG